MGKDVVLRTGLKLPLVIDYEKVKPARENKNNYIDIFLNLLQNQCKCLFTFMSRIGIN